MPAQVDLGPRLLQMPNSQLTDPDHKRRIAIAKYHKVRMSSQVTLPVLRLTSLYMCAVPPGPSPPPPSHSATNLSLSMPHASAEYSNHRLHRSKGSAFAGSGPNSSGMMRIGSSSFCLHGIEAIAPLVAASRGHDRFFDEFRLVKGQQHPAAHAALLACLEEQKIAARGGLAEREIVGAGAKALERSFDRLRRGGLLVRGKSRRLAIRRINPVSAEKQDLARLPAIFGLCQPAKRAIERGDASRDGLRAKAEILEKLQLGAR